MINVVDFFSGCGGASLGFRQAGLRIAACVEIDRDAAATFAANFPEATAFCRDIRKLDPSDLVPALSGLSGPLLFTGCAPCQPFSKQNRNRNPRDERIDLMDGFSRFVEYFHPDYIFIENIPQLQKIPSLNSPLHKFIGRLLKLGYPAPTAATVTVCQDPKDLGRTQAGQGHPELGST